MKADTSPEACEAMAADLACAADEHCSDGDMWPFDDMGKAAALIRALVAERNAERTRAQIAEAHVHRLTYALDQFDGIPEPEPSSSMLELFRLVKVTITKAIEAREAAKSAVFLDPSRKTLGSRLNKASMTIRALIKERDADNADLVGLTDKPTWKEACKEWSEKYATLFARCEAAEANLANARKAMFSVHSKFRLARTSTQVAAAITNMDKALRAALENGK